MEKAVFDLDERKIRRLKNRIIASENVNLRTKEKTTDQMIKDIKKWIEEEVDCHTQ